MLEPPFTQSSGLVLAMQLFFAPGNVLAVVLGVGLMRRSEWMRRIAQVVFLLMLGLAALQVGMQVAAWRFNSNTPLGVTTLIVAAVYFWYFGRPRVKQQFQARRRPASRQPVAAGVTDAAPGRDTNPVALTVCACMEILLGLAAVALTVDLWTTFSGEPLLRGTELAAMPPEEDLLKMFLFVTFALLLSPHVLTAAASVGILLRRATADMARRYSLVACWTVIGGLLFTIWLTSHPELSFDVRNARVLGAFCAFSLVWHLCFLYVLARSPPPVGATPAATRATR